MKSKLFSFLLDKRFPHFYSYNYLKILNINSKIKNHNFKRINISLTFDVERLPNGKLINPSQFFQRIEKKIGEKNIKFTFFCESSIIEKYPESTNKIKKYNEIGLHGYRHELWGSEKWWLRKKPIKYKEKINLLEKSMEIFVRNGLKKPKSFRAPYLIVNKETKDLLENFGFSVDSSEPSYLGVYPIPNFYGNLLGIPVTSDPIPKIKKIKNIPFFIYDILTLKTLKDMEKNDFLNLINRVLNFQYTFGINPHLVFLSHSWEFTKIEGNEYNYCSEKNYDLIINLLEILEKIYKLKYLTISKLKKVIVK